MDTIHWIHLDVRLLNRILKRRIVQWMTSDVGNGAHFDFNRNYLVEYGDWVFPGGADPSAADKPFRRSQLLCLRQQVIFIRLSDMRA